MTEKVSDEMLMAYVDGELGADTVEHVRVAIAADPALAQRASDLRHSRDLAREAYDDVISERPPERLVTALRRRRSPQIAPLLAVPFAARMALPLAAALVLVAGLGGYLAGQVTEPGRSHLLGGAVLAEAVANLRPGEIRELRIGGVPVVLTGLATYEVEGGICRTFEANSLSEGTVRGVGCGYGDAWHVGAAVAVAPGNGFAPASSGAAMALDAYLDALDARGPLDPDAENRLRQQPPR